MYRHSAALNYVPKNASLPSPEHTSDSDSEIHEVLDQKRRQLEEDVALFRTAKEKEFRDFEQCLRQKRRKSRAQGASGSEMSPSKPGNPGTSALDLLAFAPTGSPNSRVGHKSKKSGERGGEKSPKPAAVSKATLSLDKLNISGETTPSGNVLATPQTPTTLQSGTRRSPPRPSALGASPKRRHDSPPLVQPPTPAKERPDYLSGVFMASFIPLLESNENTPVVTSPQPISAQEEKSKQVLLDAELEEASKQQAAHSLPSQPVSPQIVATIRANSSPQLPSKTPPSALRNGSGTTLRKRKRVTFQLADSAIVEPSSSYEEMPSPDTRSDSDSMSGGDKVSRNGDTSPNLSETASNKPKLSSGTAKEKGSRKFRSPLPSPLPSPSPSPVIQGQPGLLASPDESGFSGGLVEADDGGSGVGFFELDEELASPGLGEKKLFPDDDLDVEIDEKSDEKVGLGLKTGRDTNGTEHYGSFAAGSLPIDIRPTGSWVGSFGH